MDYLRDDWDLDRFLEENKENQRQRLETELERIQIQLDRRDELNEEVLDELGSKLDWYLERLEDDRVVFRLFREFQSEQLPLT